MIKLNGHIITPTIFPDKTSQVWKLPKNLIHITRNVIRWEFENEAEFIHLVQLKTLISKTFFAAYSVLELPYLPYARQDKAITNESTFAFLPFCKLLNTLDFDEVQVFDPHNNELAMDSIDGCVVAMPNISKIVKAAGNAIPVYPDAGASRRYVAMNKAIYCEKVREPLTGAIVGVKVNGKIKKQSYVIIDDICDGGRTFIEVAKVLYQKGAKEVHLYVSHGIFSKGLEPLREAGIKRIFTRKGEVL